jgi:gamma-glutamyl phosphate reductase
MDMAKRIVVDAKVDYPAACNAMVNYLLYTSILIISILMTLNSIAVNMGLHFFVAALLLFPGNTSCSQRFKSE